MCAVIKDLQRILHLTAAYGIKRFALPLPEPVFGLGGIQGLQGHPVIRIPTAVVPLHVGKRCKRIDVTLVAGVLS